MIGIECTLDDFKEALEALTERKAESSPYHHRDQSYRRFCDALQQAPQRRIYNGCGYSNKGYDVRSSGIDP